MVLETINTARQPVLATEISQDTDTGKRPQLTSEQTSPTTDPRCAAGLRRPAHQKTIPIHMLYESGGSAIYEQIERHPDYYPYETERHLLHQHAQDLIAAIPPHAVLLELGCGDCTKTKILLSALAQRDGRVDLVGIDASAECLASVQAHFEGSKEVHFTAIHDNFFDGLALAARLYRGRDLCVTLLGSTLGNMSFADSCLFLRNMVEIANASGGAVRVLLGLDLWKDEALLRRAYDNDVTAQFELGGLRNTLRSFDPHHHFHADDWRYVVEINPIVNQVEMYAEAVRAQTIHDVHIEEGERILLEVSHKFRPFELERLFEGCKVVQSVDASFLRQKGYCVVVLTPDAPAETNPWMRYGDDDIYDIDRVACLDYAAFVHAYDWPEPEGHPISLLDVGCGSGALPTMLHATTGASRRFAAHVGAYDLLDISANSLRIAADRIPFQVGRKYLTSIQDFSNTEHFAEAVATGYDVVWSIHGITAVRHADLWQVLLNLLSAVKVGGRLVVVMSDHDSHYARIDRAWHADQLERGQSPREHFLVAEEVVSMLRGHEIPCEVIQVQTDHVFPDAEAESWRNFNAWCVYDPSFDILNGGPAAQAYLRSCWDPERQGYRLRLSSFAITVKCDALTRLRYLARAQGSTITALGAEAYARACAVFEAHSTQRSAILQHVAEADVLPARSVLRALSLGCGDGQQDLAMLAAGLQGVDTVVYTGIDASPAQRARWQQTVAALDGRLGHAHLHAAVLDTPDALPPEARFDSVLLLHVLYYVDNLHQTLRDAAARVAPGGRMVIWHAPMEEMNQLASVFWAPQRPTPIPFAAEVAQALTDLGLRFTQTRIDAGLSVASASDEVRDRLISFLIQAEITRLSPEVQAAVADHLRRLQRPDGTIAHPVCCFVVEPA